MSYSLIKRVNKKGEDTMSKQQHKLLGFSIIGILLILGFYWYNTESSFFSMYNQRNNGRNSMHGDNEPKLTNIKTSKNNKLLIPPLLEATSETKNSIQYDIVAQKGDTQIKKGEKTKTLGYNGSLLGPVIKLKQGQQVTINTSNKLNTNTSFHWHGLKVDDNADGSPHHLIKPETTEKITFNVDQEAATLWFHPHPEGQTASQVYEGLAGLMYIEDKNSDKLDLPSNYGVNDIPLIVQDRYFDENNQIDYDESYQSDGTQGDTLMINGTINPSLEVKNRWIRYRLINGSNATNFTFSFDGQIDFYQVASDGGFLNKPTKMSRLTLSPGERAEIIVDTKESLTRDKLNLLVNDQIALHMNLLKQDKKETFLTNQVLNRLPQVDKSKLETLPNQQINLKGMSHMVSINGEQFEMDRINLTKKLGTKEVWEVNNISNMMGGMIHPFHIHGVQFQVISRNGKQPSANELGWKDTILVNPDEQIKLLISFDKKGIFMYHCHILEHEEYGMMGQMEVK